MNHASIRAMRRAPRGFTLVELLIVIVILGILATVTVFAVRGITDQGDESAEASDLRTLQTAAESYMAQTGDNAADEAELVTSGFLGDESALHDYTLNGDGSYTITNLRTGATMTSTGGGGGGGGGGSAWSGGATTIAGVPAVTASNAGGANTVIWFGGDQTRAAWNAALDAGRTVAVSGMPGGDTLVMIDIADIADQTALEAVMAEVLNPGINYSWSVPEDDVAGFCDNVDGDPVPFSVCAQIAALDVGAANPIDLVDSWPVAGIDGLFDA